MERTCGNHLYKRSQYLAPNLQTMNPGDSGCICQVHFQIEHIPHLNARFSSSFIAYLPSKWPKLSYTFLVQAVEDRICDPGTTASPVTDGNVCTCSEDAECNLCTASCPQSVADGTDFSFDGTEFEFCVGQRPENGASGQDLNEAECDSNTCSTLCRIKCGGIDEYSSQDCAPVDGSTAQCSPNGRGNAAINPITGEPLSGDCCRCVL